MGCLFNSRGLFDQDYGSGFAHVNERERHRAAAARRHCRFILLVGSILN
jgi:hypothetical protein